MKRSILYISALCLMALSSCETEDRSVKLPMVNTEAAWDVTSSSAILKGSLAYSVKNGGDALFMFEVSPSPTFEDAVYSDSITIALECDAPVAFELPVRGLRDATEYYYRVRLTKGSSRLSSPIYSEPMTFTTSWAAGDIRANITSVNAYSRTARVYGSFLVNHGVMKECGFLLGSENTSLLILKSNKEKKTCSEAVTNVNWVNLTPGTTYKTRAYAVDDNGTAFYSDIRTFTTATEAGGSLTVDDFTGTYTVTAISPWESNAIKTWNNVRFTRYSNDTIIADGWEDLAYLRAVGIFDQGLQVVRFENGWYFPDATFTFNRVSCVAEFTPAYYSTSDRTAYYILDGGRYDYGEIWLKKTGTNTFDFIIPQYEDQNGRRANGFLFLYNSVSDYERLGNSYVYTSVSLRRTSTSTSAPDRQAEQYMIPLKPIKSQPYETTTITPDFATDGTDILK
ncbi:MAG: hypothetical protein IKN59_07030 [Paludibacteraceae bacterium]|nr:hypothetical protein [Paludibacteraceae bacterium]